MGHNLRVSLLLEVIVQSVVDAVAATEGGADRLEVVRDLHREGLTPPLEVVRAIASETAVPLRVMLREREGFAAPDRRELRVLQRTCAALGEMGVHGVVLGFLRGGRVDVDTTAAVLAAWPLRATFHRAFDALAEPDAGIEAIRALPQVDRILTSGGAGGWVERCRRLRVLAALGAPQLTLVAGGGVDEHALPIVVAAGAVREVHVGRAARESSARMGSVSAERVSRLKALAAGI